MAVVEYLQNDRAQWGVVVGADKKGLRVRSSQGRDVKVASDKVLFEHEGDALDRVVTARDALVADIDIELLWETALEEAPTVAQEAPALALLYFDAKTPLHASAVYHALVTDRLRFRRRGRTFVPRAEQDINQLRVQEAAQQARVNEATTIKDALRKRQPDGPLCDRLERWLRGNEDRALLRVLEDVYRDPAPRVFDVLVAAGHLETTADLAVVQANLRLDHPTAVLTHAASIEAPAVTDAKAAGVSIDDPDTREVDDVITVTEEGDLIRIDVDIADVAAWVSAGDPMDREAQRRASTAYLPTGAVYMLPERIGCDLASLHVDTPRPVFRTTAWFDADGNLVRHDMERTAIRVQRRLDYDEADALLEDADDPLGEQLRRAYRVAEELGRVRQEAGSFSFSRPEWKVRVDLDSGEIRIKPIAMDSPSRRLVSEMMILVNRLGAERASEADVPVIYRTQERPKGDLPDLAPDDPTAFLQLRGLIQPASLSLKPGWHWGLGLPAYTQLSSPLRRYADLIGQRQLGAAIAGKPPVYGPQELLKILANAEGTERELKRVEADVSQRWAMEWVKQQPEDTVLNARIAGDAPAGHRVTIQECGARGVLVDDRAHVPGAHVPVRVQRVQPRGGTLRLRPAD